jgi:hypothetical protein
MAPRLRSTAIGQPEFLLASYILRNVLSINLPLSKFLKTKNTYFSKKISNFIML